MTYRKGERTNKHREATYPHAVDIPIVAPGLGMALHTIADETRRCGGEHWSYRVRGEDGTPFYWARIGVKTEEDAERLVRVFAGLNAKRGR